MEMADPELKEIPVREGDTAIRKRAAQRNMLVKRNILEQYAKSLCGDSLRLVIFSFNKWQCSIQRKQL